jgi:hypothetical protein
MEPFKESTLHPSIVEASKSVEIAKAKLQSITKAIQDKCKHRIISEVSWTSINPARRICNHCKFVEKGTHWSGGSNWSNEDYSKPILGNEEGRIVVQITQETFYSMLK